MEMQQIEADFGINLKDMQPQDIMMKLGEVEYIFSADKGTWKTKANNEMEELELEDKGKKGFEKGKKKQKVDDDEKLNVQEMNYQIKTLQKQIGNTQQQIEVIDQSIQIVREKMKKVKLENDRLTFLYIDEHLETEVLIKQGDAILQIQKKINEEENIII